MPDLVDRIEQQIKFLGTNFKRVEEATGLGNGTIKRWREQSPRLDRLILVAEYLGVSLDYLVYGVLGSEKSPPGDFRTMLAEMKEAQGLTCDGSPLSEIEADLVAMYRLLPEEHQEEVFDLVHLKYEKHVERKKGSIFWTYADDEKGGSVQGEIPNGTA